MIEQIETAEPRRKFVAGESDAARKTATVHSCKTLWCILKGNSLKNLSNILLLGILSLSNSFGQTETIDQNIDNHNNIDLTRKVCAINEIKNLLLTKDGKNNDAIFVYLDTNFFDVEIFDQESSTPFYVWYKKTFFFYNINYWLLPISIDRVANEIYYKFRTCSFVKDEERKYYEGQVTFMKDNNDWYVKEYMITKAKFCCGQTK